MGRFRERYLIVNLPNKDQLDRDLFALADVWIMVESKGSALVHELKWNNYRSKLQTPKRQRLRWNGFESERLEAIYEELEEEKARQLQSVHQDGQPAATDGGQSKSSRNDRIREMAEKDITHADIADVFDIDRSRVTKIVNKDG